MHVELDHAQVTVCVHDVAAAARLLGPRGPAPLMAWSERLVASLDREVGERHPAGMRQVERLEPLAGRRRDPTSGSRPGRTGPLNLSTSSPRRRNGRLTEEAKLIDDARIDLYWLPLGAGDSSHCVRGDMWNSNSLITWRFARSGHDAADLHAPAGGRAHPGGARSWSRRCARKSDPTMERRCHTTV
jgi:hypothetical protein